ncbi:MAG: sodium:proton antiporter [Phycisphaerae bacterium]
MPQSAAQPLPKWVIGVGLAGALGIANLAGYLEHLGHGAVVPAVSLGWVVPFALLLLCIAVLPFVANHFWHKYYPAVTLGLATLVAGYYVLGLPGPRGGWPNLAEHLAEYISFVFIMGSLFIVSGGILIRVREGNDGSRWAAPLANVTLLLIGAVLANFFGTTGASMLLIRPYLRMNQGRLRPYHVVFFIFLVANIGGGLTPIGDPPLFLGFLRGVPFWWVAEHCWLMWLLTVGLLLGIFFIIDWRASNPNRDRQGAVNVPIAKRVAEVTPLPNGRGSDALGPLVSVYGAGNLAFIGLIVAGILLHEKLYNGVAPLQWREMLMALAAAGSLWLTPHRIHGENHFNYVPIKEVAFLFAGIFITMVPALNYLDRHASDPALDKLLQTPGQYFYLSGGLSSVLDNAPTYVTFLEAELGKLDKVAVERAVEIARQPWQVHGDPYANLTPAQRGQAQAAVAALEKYYPATVHTNALTVAQVRVAFLLGDEKLNLYLIAISMGSVFFGACTYIGNGPNFMVKSIAEHAGAEVPSFFGYILCYTLPVLMPVFAVVWWGFLR